MNSLGPDEQTPTANADLIAAVVSSSPAVVSSSPDIPDEAIEAARDAVIQSFESHYMTTGRDPQGGYRAICKCGHVLVPVSVEPRNYPVRAAHHTHLADVALAAAAPALTRQAVEEVADVRKELDRQVNENTDLRSALATVRQHLTDSERTGTRLEDEAAAAVEAEREGIATAIEAEAARWDTRFDRHAGLAAAARIARAEPEPT